MDRRACLAIGVGHILPPKPNGTKAFGYLDGAPIAARHIADWALKSRYGADNVRLVTDEYVNDKPNPVTRERVQTAVDQLFPAGAAPVEHLLLAFCGHGLTDENLRAISWLFSDSLELKYRVKADLFCSELLLHGVKRLTLISDACREPPKTSSLLRLDPVRGIVVQGDQIPNPKIDSLLACQDTKLGYMVSVRNSGRPGKCIFSGVILDALWGEEPSAFADSQITVRSLGDCIQQRTPTRARDYNLTLNPDCLTNPEELAIYHKANPPIGPHALQPWPPAGSSTILGAIDTDEDPTEAVKLNDLDETGRSILKSTLGPKFGANHFELATGELPEAISPTGEEALGQLFRAAAARPQGTGFLRETRQALIVRIAADAAAQVRTAAARSVRRSLVQIKPDASYGSNLIIAEKGARFFADRTIERRRSTAAREGFHVTPDPAGRPILVKLRGDAVVPVVPYAGLYLVMKRSDLGDIYQAYGEEDCRAEFNRALKAVADFGAGRIAASDIDRLAAEIRSGKHRDPALGAICAYLYRAAADFDNIRRMAYYFVENGQPVPFDIALLGDMSVTRNDGALHVTVPAVAARTSRGDGDTLPYYARAETSETVGAVGGLCPWIAQGWDYVAAHREPASELLRDISDIASTVRRRGFTQFSPVVGARLAKLWGLPHR